MTGKPLLLVAATLVAAATALAGNDFLWLSYGKTIKGRDGSATLPLTVKFGEFPGREIPLAMANIKAYCSKDGEAFQSVPLKDGLVKIKAGKTCRHEVVVEAEAGGRHYSAATVFMLYGKGGSAPPDAVPAAPRNHLGLVMQSRFNYWPETGKPFTLACSFDGKPLPGAPLELHDANLPTVELRSGQDGSYAYLPPDDKRLNWQGETAFKELVAVARHGAHCSSYTHILHRARYGNNRLGPGLALFGAALAATLGGAVWTRRRGLA